MARDTRSVPETGGDARPIWSLRLFGEFELSECAGGRKIAVPGKRERVLLAYLALNPNRRELRRKLATLLWGEDSDETTLDNLRTCVFHLRKALGNAGHQAIFSDGREIGVDDTAFEVDVLEFGRLADSSDLSSLQQAASLYTGELLDGIAIESEAFESWRRDEATRCRDRAVNLLSSLMVQFDNLGETQRSIDTGLRILRLEPLHESTVRLLMRAYCDSGRRSAAIQLYRDLAERLKAELNALPEAATRNAMAEIANGSETNTPPVLTAPRLPDHTPPAATLVSGRTRAPFPPRAALSILAVLLIAAAAALYYPMQGMLDRTAAGKALPPLSSRNVALSVVPFSNLSGDPAQKFFSDGMTEDVVSALTRIPGLRVVGRNSAFRLDAENHGAADIAAKLGASHLLEGSVRNTGQRLQITAKLVRAADGKTLWTQAYDRELTGAFAIQNQIAGAVADALHVQIGTDPTANPVSSDIAIDPESYRQYLAAKSLVRARYIGVPHAIDILEPVVARYPDYAPASALLSSAYVYLTAIDHHKIAEFWPKADSAARQAIRSDPGLANGYFALAELQRLRGKQIEAATLIQKALALDPDNPDALDLYSMQLANVGRLKEALIIAERLHELEPSVPGFSADLGRVYWANGRNTDAIRILMSVINFGAVRTSLAMVYASMGRYAEAADLLEHDGRRADLRDQSVNAAHILRFAPSKIPQGINFQPFNTDSFPVDFVYLYVGAPEHALESYEYKMKSGEIGGPGDGFALLWHTSYAPVRNTAEFKALMRNAGIVDYWRENGWPEFCHATTRDDFTCR